METILNALVQTLNEKIKTVNSENEIYGLSSCDLAIIFAEYIVSNSSRFIIPTIGKFPEDHYVCVLSTSEDDDTLIIVDLSWPELQTFDDACFIFCNEAELETMSIDKAKSENFVWNDSEEPVYYFDELNRLLNN